MNRKAIKGYEGIYQITTSGLVYSVKRSMFLSPHEANNGYLIVNLSKKGETKSYTVHRLMAITFLENPNNCPCVDHINRVRTDNKLSNLRWCTYSENNYNKEKMFPNGKIRLAKNGESSNSWEASITKDKNRHRKKFPNTEEGLKKAKIWLSQYQ